MRFTASAAEPSACPHILIVMATHGRTGLPRAVLGSVAEAVLRHEPCPVLTIPPKALHASAAAGPDASGSDDRRVEIPIAGLR